MSPPVEPPSAAFCEDFNEDSGTSLPGTRKIANVAAKRSKPELAGKGRSSVDGTGDSGYSSRTAETGAMIGSVDSEPRKSKGPKGSKGSTPLRLDTTFRDRERRPYGPDMKAQSQRPEQGRPEQLDNKSTVHRSSSKAGKSEHVKHDQGTYQESDQHGGQPPTPKPTSKQSKNTTVPPSPSRSRRGNLPQPKQDSVPMENLEARPRPRRSSSVNPSGARPKSFHAGMSMPAEPAFYSYVQQPALSPWPQTATYSPYPSYPPSAFPAGFTTTPITPITNMQPSAPLYEMPPPARLSYPRRLSSHGQPIIQQEYPPSPAEHRPPSRQERRDPSRSRNSEREEDHRRMPPPPPPKPQVFQLPSRPSAKKFATTNSAPTVRQSKYDDLKPLSRSSSHRRPSESERRGQILVRPQNRKSVSYEDEPAPTRRPERHLPRRSTIYGHEGLKDLEDLEQKQKAAEDYQKAQGTSSLPFTAGSLQRARSNATAPRRSETGSHRSHNSSSKGSGTKSQQDNDITMTTKGVRLGFSGDNRDIRIKSKASGPTQIQIEEKKPRRYSLTSVRRVPSNKERENLVLDDTSERASRKSSRSGRSGK